MPETAGGTAPPDGHTRWCVSLMTRATSFSPTRIHLWWQAANIQPHRVRTLGQEIAPRETLWDTPAIMDFINFQLYACINEFEVSPTPAMMEGGSNQINSGNMAMKMEEPWFFPKMACREWSCTEEAMAENYVPFGLAQLPKASSGTRTHMVFGHVLLMNSCTEHPDETWEFLKFADGERTQKYVAQSGCQPVTPDFNERLWKLSTIENGAWKIPSRSSTPSSRASFTWPAKWTTATSRRKRSVRPGTAWWRATPTPSRLSLNRTRRFRACWMSTGPAKANRHGTVSRSGNPGCRFVLSYSQGHARWNQCRCPTNSWSSSGTTAT